MLIPILVISGFGVGESYGYLNLFMKTVITLFLKDQYRDKALMEQVFESSKLSWEMVQPGILKDQKLTSRYNVHSALFKGIKIGKISRADVGHYMLNEAASPAHLKMKVAVTY